MTDTPDKSASAASGLAAGGRGGPQDELLDSGQEEVFSLAEVEAGAIEHQSSAGGSGTLPAAPARGADEVRPEEE